MLVVWRPASPPPLTTYSRAWRWPSWRISWRLLWCYSRRRSIATGCSSTPVSSSMKVPNCHCLMMSHSTDWWEWLKVYVCVCVFFIQAQSIVSENSVRSCWVPSTNQRLQPGSPPLWYDTVCWLNLFRLHFTFFLIKWLLDHQNYCWLICW